MATASALAHEPAASKGQRVVCVDLDGTLVVGDLLWESLIALAKRHPFRALALFVRSLWRGPAHLKRCVSGCIPVDAARLSYRDDLLTHLQTLRDEGATLVLVTGSDRNYADAVASHLGLFDAVLASDGQVNLSGHRKARALVDRYGAQRFEYIGNDWADVPVWQVSSSGTAVAVPPRLARHASKQLAVHVRSTRRALPQAIVKALRPHQWAKNVLVFLPFLAAHDFLRWDLWALSVLTFIAFSCCASGIYVFNDMLDIPADRAHPRKRRRPFAAGDLSIPIGVTLGCGLLAMAALIAYVGVSPWLVLVGALYAVSASAYSYRLKQEPVADVFLLTGLYLVRIVAGAVATATPLSNWLLAFALFFFLSLAFVKRYTEVLGITGWIPGRGYSSDDARWMHGAGMSAGYMAVLVLALYVNAPEVTVLYRRPQLLFALCPVLLFWITRLWLRAGRRVLRDDPVSEALRDPGSYLVGAVSLLVLLAAM